MNKDSRLIFDNYKNSKNELISEEWYNNFGDWDWKALAEVGKVLDPTGISSWGDFFKSIGEYAKEPQNPMKMAMVFINGYCCIPNLGLLAGGVGGIGWAALRGAAKKAASNPTAAVSISEKILKFMSKSPKIAGAFDKVLQNAVNKKLINKSAKDQLMHVVNKGKMDNVAHAQNIEKIVNKANPLKPGESLGAGDMFSAGLRPEKGIGHTVFGNTVSVPPYIKGVDVPFAGALKGSLRTGKGINDYANPEEEEKVKDNRKTVSIKRWIELNPGKVWNFNKMPVGSAVTMGNEVVYITEEDVTDKFDPDKVNTEDILKPEKETPEAAAKEAPETDSWMKRFGDSLRPKTGSAAPTGAAPTPSKPMSSADFKKADYEQVDKQEKEQAAKPVEASTTKEYQGVSIVDFLDQSGKPSDFASRKELAQKMGIPEYTGTASQNLLLLNALRGGKTEIPVKQATVASPSYTSKYMGPAKTAAPKPTDLLPKSGTKGKEVSTQFVRIGPGNYRPAVQADLTSKQQIFVRNPNPAARLVYPFIKAENAPVRRANL